MRLTTKITTLCAALLGALTCTAVLAQPRALRPVTDAMLQNPDPADWLSWRRTRDHWGYSPLTEVNKRNVTQLRLVWTRPLAQGVQEGTPLVHDGVMFFPKNKQAATHVSNLLKNSAVSKIYWAVVAGSPDAGDLPVPPGPPVRRENRDE